MFFFPQTISEKLYMTFLHQRYLQHSRFYSDTQLFLHLSRASWFLCVQKKYFGAGKRAIISDLSLSSASWIQHGFEHGILMKSFLVERSASEYAGKYFCSERLSTQANLLHDCTNYGKGVWCAGEQLVYKTRVVILNTYII